MKYVLGIDIGTGSTKAVAVNLNSKPISVSQVHYTVQSPKPGYSEQDPEIIWEAFKNCLQATLDKLEYSPVVICLSSAMHSLIPVNRTGGKLSDMITWADARSGGIALGLKESAEGRNIYETSGMPLHAMSPLCKIIWLRENEPRIFDQAYKFISIKEYIWFRLFGEYVVDHSIACATGMFDISKLKWSPPLLQLAGITEDRLSRPVSTTYTAGGQNFLYGMMDGLSKETSFVIGASDGCLANLGSFAIRKGVAALTVGTSGAVRIASTKPIFSHQAYTFSYCLDEHTFICGGPVNNGGNVLQWLTREFLGQTADEQSFTELFERISVLNPGSDGLIFLPYLNGERAPIWDTKSSGAFIGIRSDHTQAHFCRAALEGVCYALTDVLIAVESGSEPIDQINVSGGFISSETWMQLLSDISGKRLFLMQTEDASAIGAAFLGMKASGLSNGYPEAPEEKEHRILEPDMARHEFYKQHFTIFKSLYSSLKDSMHQLHQIRP